MAEQWISFLLPIARIKRDELTKTLLMFVYFFLTITSYYILKPVRDSIFITQYGAENLPWVWLTTILVLSFLASAYVKFVDYLQKNVLLSSTVIFFVINVGIFRWLAEYQFRWTGFVFFIWVSVFSVMVVTQFWLYANDLFNPREAKRLYGIVGSGGILGGIAGGAITSHFATIVGTQNLLMVAGFILLSCVLVINIIWQLEQERSLLGTKQKLPEEVACFRETRQFVSLIWKKRYLILLLSLVFLAKSVSTLVEYQFKNVVQGQIIGMDLRTAFFGKFYVWLNTASFLIQFFLTSRILRYFGVRSALLLLPAGLLVGSSGILLNPSLWLAVGTMMYDGAVNYSLNNSTKEVLYLPIFREIRYRVKPFIDMLGYRFAKGAASVLILLCTKAAGFNESQLSFVALALIVLWLVTIRSMKHEYPNALREFLSTEGSPYELKRQIDSEEQLLTECLPRLNQRNDSDLLRALLAGEKEVREGGHPGLRNHTEASLLGEKATENLLLRCLSQPLVEMDPSANELPQDFQGNDQWLKVVRTLLMKGSFSAVQKRNLASLLMTDGSQEAAELLFLMLDDPDSLTRQRTAQALAHLHRRNPALSVAFSLVKEEIGREIGRGHRTKQIIQVYQFYQKKLQKRLGDSERDPFLLAQEERVSEILERVFLLLGFFSEPQDMKIIYGGLLDRNPQVKANAVELLDNVLADPSLKRLVLGLLDGEEPAQRFFIGAKRRRKAVLEHLRVSNPKEFLKELLHSDDAWGFLSGCTMVLRFGLKDFLQEVDLVSRSNKPLMGEFAGVVRKELSAS